MAIGMLAMFGAMVSFYFAFHPGGVTDASGVNLVNNPPDILRYLVSEFQMVAGGGTLAAPAGGGILPTPTGGSNPGTLPGG